jgi:tryptophan-rich sensory protein
MKDMNWLWFIACVAGVVAVGSLSGLANAGRIEGWYEGLQKPAYNPPNYLFAPVWTVLYILMGISLYLVLRMPASAMKTTAITVFAVQLALNFSWSFLFFYFRLPGMAFIEILAMWGVILWMILAFLKVSPVAAWLNIPYLLWVSFATVLNGSIWYLNR